VHFNQFDVRNYPKLLYFGESAAINWETNCNNKLSAWKYIYDIRFSDIVKGTYVVAPNIYSYFECNLDFVF
jgi:hypothetical protein